MEEQVPNKYKQVLVESKVTEDDAFVTKDIEEIASSFVPPHATSVKDMHKAEMSFKIRFIRFLLSYYTIGQRNHKPHYANAFLPVYNW